MTNGGNFDERSAIGKYRTDTIYPNNFKSGAGKFFTVVTEEDGPEFWGEVQPRRH